MAKPTIENCCMMDDDKGSEKGSQVVQRMVSGNLSLGPG
jgi:hypothetical protein